MLWYVICSLCHTELAADNSDQNSNNSEKIRSAVISYGHIELYLT